MVVFRLFEKLRYSNESIGNLGSLCVTRDITRVNYREHMRRSLSSENLLENGNKNR